MPDLVGSRTSVTFALTGPDGQIYDYLGRPLEAPVHFSGFKGRVYAGHLTPGDWRVTVTADDGRSWSATPTIVAEETVEETLHAKSDGGR